MCVQVWSPKALEGGQHSRPMGLVCAVTEGLWKGRDAQALVHQSTGRLGLPETGEKVLCKLLELLLAGQALEISVCMSVRRTGVNVSDSSASFKCSCV